MKNLLITTLFTIGLAINAQAAPSEYMAYTVASGTGTSSLTVYASSTASNTLNLLGTSTASSPLDWDMEVNNNYSEILGLNDCKVLGKRVTQRIEKINDKLDKQHKAVSNLIDKINEIKDDEVVQADASTTEMLTVETENLNIKMQTLSTGTLKYVKSLKGIDTVKCLPNLKSVKLQLSATKPLYKDMLIADSDLKSYISNDIKRTLITLKGDMPTSTVGTSAAATNTMATSIIGTSTATTSKDKVEEKGFWFTVKGLFK